MGNENMSPNSGKRFRSDGSIADDGNSYDEYNRKISIEAERDETNNGNLYGTARVFTLAADATAYLTFDVPDKYIFITNRIINATDEGSGGVDLEVDTFEDATIDTQGNNVVIQNANRNSSNTSEISIYDETTSVDITGATQILPTSDRITADKKSRNVVFVAIGYLIKKNAVTAVRFINNSTTNVEIRHKVLWIERELVL